MGSILLGKFAFYDSQKLALTLNEVDSKASPLFMLLRATASTFPAMAFLVGLDFMAIFSVVFCIFSSFPKVSSKSFHLLPA